MIPSRWMMPLAGGLILTACSVYTPDLLEGSGGAGTTGPSTTAITSGGGNGTTSSSGSTTSATTGTTSATTGVTTSATTNATTNATTTTGTGGSAPVEVWINELHYDNAGADADEGVEIAGTAGVNLTGWSLVPYNGANGTISGGPGTVALSGTLPAQMNGYGAIWFPIVGLENGAPDGMALVDPQNTVVLFLSYEGAFSATAGPANGMMSVDMVANEEPAPAAGVSLQLTGNGNSYADFMWAEDVAASPNQLNPGQTIQ